MTSSTILAKPIQSTNVDGAMQELRALLLLSNAPAVEVDYYTARLDALAFVSLPDRQPDEPDIAIAWAYGLLSVIGVDPYYPAQKGDQAFWLSDGGQLLAGVLYNAYTGRLIAIKDAAEMLGIFPQNIGRWVKPGMLTAVPLPRWTQTKWSAYYRERRGDTERVHYMLVRSEVMKLKRHRTQAKKHKE